MARNRPRAVLGAVVWLVLWGGLAAAQPWQAVEEPALKEALDRAPLLEAESLGEPARGVNVWERWAVPNPDGETWDLLQIYFKEYYGPTWLYAFDLGTRQVRKQRLPDGFQFYLSGRALGFDGKYYIATPFRRTGNMHLFVYDPASNTLDERGEIVPGLGGEVRPLATGPDGRLYGTGTRGNQLGLYIYDPVLGEVVKDFGPVGPSHPNGAWSGYVMGVDHTHAYLASGMLPAWYLVAVDLESGDTKVLLESPTEHRISIVESFPGAWAIVPQGAGAPRREYWLYGGEAIPKTDNAPPWTEQPSPWETAGPKPELHYEQLDPDAAGSAALWYRLPDDAAQAPDDPPADARPEDLGWQAIHVEEVATYPSRLGPLALLPDGRLYGAGEMYFGSFVFDPDTETATLLGRNQGLSGYTNIAFGDRLYSSGYPGGPLFVFDPKRPWTAFRGGPPGHPAPGLSDAQCNPRRLGSLEASTRVAIARSSAIGADGRIYFGGFGVRHYTGGGLGWLDPKTEAIGGLWKPLSGYGVHWIAPVQEGRKVVISTVTRPDEEQDHRVPEEAKLFLYDVERGEIVMEIVPVEKARTTGLIVEASPGRLLGLTTSAAAPGQPADSILYGVDVTTGETLFRKALPYPVSVDAYWPRWVDPAHEYLELQRGPDGFAWTYLRDVLVRIDPRDAAVHVVGRVDPPGRPTFVGRDIYLSGTEQLRRIREVVPMP